MTYEFFNFIEAEVDARKENVKNLFPTAKVPKNKFVRGGG